MTWETFYLICFGVGLALTALSLAGGFHHFNRFTAGMTHNEGRPPIAKRFDEHFNRSSHRQSCPMMGIDIA